MQVDDAKRSGSCSANIIIEYSKNYSKTSGSLWKYCRYEPNATIIGSNSFKCKARITERTPNDGNTEDVEIAASLKF